MNVKYYAIYSSTTAGTTGCVKTFLTQPIEGGNSFAPQVEYECDLCNKKHGFRLKTTHLVSTPSQDRSILSYAAKENMESNVSVPYFSSKPKSGR